MERIIKLSLVILIFLTPIEVRAAADLTGLEMIIAAHKEITTFERLAIAELETVNIEHKSTTDFAKKCKNARDYLNQRMADINSLVLFTTRLFYMGEDLAKMIKQYKEFASMTFKNADKHPFLIAYFASINYKLSIELESIRKRFEKFPAFQTNILKATMKEKNQILDFIAASISNLEYMLSRANYRCKLIASVGVQEWNIKEFLSDRDNKQAMDKLIEQWNIQTGEKG